MSPGLGLKGAQGARPVQLADGLVPAWKRKVGLRREGGRKKVPASMRDADAQCSSDSGNARNSDPRFEMSRFSAIGTQGLHDCGQILKKRGFKEAMP